MGPVPRGCHRGQGHFPVFSAMAKNVETPRDFPLGLPASRHRKTPWLEARTSALSHLMETAAGDTSIGHSPLAYARIFESMGRRDGSGEEGRGRLRAIALELERIANHVGDSWRPRGRRGLICRQNPSAVACGEIFLNINRRALRQSFLGAISLGREAWAFDVSGDGALALAGRLKIPSRPRRDEAVEFALGAHHRFLARFETYRNSPPARDAIDVGLVGPAARGLRTGYGLKKRTIPRECTAIPPFRFSTSLSGDV